MKLPEKFIDRMRYLLKDEYEDFIKCYEDERYYGLRVNTTKISLDEFKSIFPYEIQPIPWCDSGYYYDSKDKPGKHPYHAAGLYYIQEPSAMVVVEAISPKPGDVVLDISAAPGGKSTQIVQKLNGEGLLVANEINTLRARALAENLERWGTKNVIILNERPENLVKTFDSFFDKIVIDAPCSGEGMFRKDPDVCYSWSEGTIMSCSKIQKGILGIAAKLLKPGGIMSYSTCTFAPEENEQTIDAFLKDHHDFELLDINIKQFFSSGRPEWGNGNEELKKCLRLWPHKIKGEGHFMALLKKNDGDVRRYRFRNIKIKRGGLEYYFDFEEKTLKKKLDANRIVSVDDHVYFIPEVMPDVRGLRVLRYGWYLGDLKKGRFEPSHAMAMGLRCTDALRCVDLQSKGDGVMDYLRGHVIRLDGELAKERGWALVCVDGYPLGWGKITGGVLKNHYPKDLRIDW